ncbi:MAG: hypothetical protein ACD_46C00581G0002 [uncultured bacterium]|nr:MAG: hypothetical protein ACD_46C00581G0002 [uncultured bacterium]
MLPKGLLKEYSRILSLIIRLIDIFAVFFAGVAAYFFKFGEIKFSQNYLIAILCGAILTSFIFSALNLYSSVRGKELLYHFFDIIKAILLLSLALASLAFFTKSGEHFSRIWFTIWMLTAFIILISYRCLILFLLRFMRSYGWNERVVVIFGAGKLGIDFAKNVQQALWTGFRIIVFIDDQADKKPAQINNIHVMQTPDDLSKFLKQEQVDEIWVALPLRAEQRVKQILHELRHDPITIRFVLDIFGLDLLNHSITELAGFPVLNVSTTPMVGINRIIKASEDRMIAAFILLLISPLLIMIAVTVKLSSNGPIIFKQKRLGWDGKVINVYKFRTMYEHQEKNNLITQATMNDKRITSIGKFLRKTSLDELPQFINVLQGKMSIVGPRPHALQHNEQYKEIIHTYMQRHRVKPGITGWAQINGWRGETDTIEKMQKRVEYDLYYINNWSLGFDLKIIFLTLFRGFISKNAY